MRASGTVSESYHSMEVRLKFRCKQDIGASVMMTKARVQLLPKTGFGLVPAGNFHGDHQQPGLILLAGRL